MGAGGPGGRAGPLLSQGLRLCEAAVGTGRGQLDGTHVPGGLVKSLLLDQSSLLLDM